GTADDGRVSLAALEAPASLTGGTDFAAALTWAASRCAAARGGGPLAVHVVTALQRTGFRDLEGFSLPKGVPVHVWDVGTATTGNVAIIEVRPVSLMVRAEQPTTVQATILNARTEPLELRPVRLRLANGSKVIEIPAVASASPGSSATVAF